MKQRHAIVLVVAGLLAGFLPGVTGVSSAQGGPVVGIASPEGVSVVVQGSGSVRVSWSSVAGASGYRVVSRPAGFGCEVSSTSCVVSGLDGRVPYRFVVQAVGGESGGGFSEPSEYVTASPHGFSDVRVAWAEDAIRWLKANGITQGISPDRYDPLGSVTRSQMALFLWRLGGEPAGPNRCGFRDVPATAGSAVAVCWLKANGITEGVSPDRYDPAGRVTRAQMVTFLWRVNGKPTMTTENPFTDVDVSKWFGQAVLWASQRQVTTNEGTFNPGNNVTRAQMAGFLFRSANFTDANEPAEDVTVIDEGELIAVGEAQPDQSAEFEDPGGGLQVGKLFVTVLPNGLPYYGRVIRRSDTTITSEPVTLRDIVPVLDVSVSANPNTGQLQTVSPDVRISDHLLVVPQNSSGSATAQCQGSITAQVSAEYRAAISSFDLDIDWGWSRVSAVSVVFTPDFAVTARSSLTASGTCSYAGELFSIQLPNISFTVGPIPVVITQSLIADVRGTFTVSREASIEVGAVAGMRLGVEYRNGRFNTIADSFLDRQMDSDLTSLVSADVELPIYYNPQAIGLADLRIGIAGEAELQIDPAKRPYLTLDGVLSGQVATTILGKEYTPQRAEFVRKRLWQLGEPVTAPVSLGWDHSCAIVSGRSVKCWGGNYWSQLGDGTQTDRLRPVAVSGLSAATAIAAGRYHTCALVAGGAVKCWGANFDGELGDGTEWSRSTPVTVSGITGATAIAAGAHHTCAIVDGGAVWCWGRNSEGQLGDGTTTGRLAPVRVSLLSGATAIAAGQYHTCAIVPSNVAYCWGNNAGGQLGDGTRTTRLTPVPVIVLGGAIALAAGEGHTCALVADGTLKCWGWNAFGQLGDGTKTDRLTPVTVSGLAGATAISEGERHTCALVAGGTVNCWGSNVGGQLGDGTMTDRLRPKSVSGLTGATAIAAGDDHTCALVPIGSVKCWGDNIYGGLGDGTATDRLTPVTVQGL